MHDREESARSWFSLMASDLHIYPRKAVAKIQHFKCLRYGFCNLRSALFTRDCYFTPTSTSAFRFRLKSLFLYSSSAICSYQGIQRLHLSVLSLASSTPPRTKKDTTTPTYRHLTLTLMPLKRTDISSSRRSTGSTKLTARMIYSFPRCGNGLVRPSFATSPSSTRSCSS